MKDIIKPGKPVNIPVICINDSDRPAEIPTSKWITKGKPYTIIEFMVLNIQNKAIGVRLAEVSLEACFPYKYYLLSRFGIPVAQYEAEAQDAINKLLEETINNPLHA